VALNRPGVRLKTDPSNLCAFCIASGRLYYTGSTLAPGTSTFAQQLWIVQFPVVW
jgi:hypothetical protein